MRLAAQDAIYLVIDGEWLGAPERDRTVITNARVAGDGTPGER
jgi:hypothetical protein